MQGGGAHHLLRVAHEIGDKEIAGLADAGRLVDDRAQGFRHRGSGVEKIHINAARPVVARCLGGDDAAVFAGPADAPCVHLADAVRPFLAQEPRQALVA